ncbi:hypothetical protein [Streptomyces sp. NPDC002889]|uniref:hypothetical protein n=1 Tax=Streptomyces sp. NPDC002889 TaxID=3364669 RepID=UPI00368067A0
MNDTAPTPAAQQDDLFGEITVRPDNQESLVVEGERIPRIEVHRAPGSQKDDQVAIGTRDPRHLTMTVNGAQVALRPAKGRLSRRSYRIEVEYDGTVWVLLPDSIPGSRLTRDGSHLGDFSSEGDGRVIAEWRAEAEVHPLDASVGYALAAAFGTGGQPAWMMAIDTVGAMLP